MFGEWSGRHSGGTNDDGSLDGDVSDGFGISFIELLNEFVSVYVGGWFPAVMCFGKTLPPDQVLYLAPISSDT